ncbi:50S ribosomal protein L23 [Blattabacterium cuenoti]|uniref:50S ribosomal protein L23 n=1 Tax=Blattabacterium cuenoti TaxID=1653831 RepID=UPI00163B75FD|nr:50S ribosomal protein L23 [Blattabacterium cuenoti]
MILIKPIFTEKSNRMNRNNFYIFSVHINCNKIQIKKEIEKIFGIFVKDVRTMIYPRKDKSKYTKKGFIFGKTNKIKKAIIKFEENQKIDFYRKKEKEN